MAAASPSVGRSAPITLALAMLLAACAERPQRYDVAPPSLAQHYTVDVTVRGTPTLIKPMGMAAGVVGGALVGGIETCIGSLGVLCVAAPVVMPLTAIAGLAVAETPDNIARAKRGLQQQDITARVGPRLLDAIVTAGNRRQSYHFVAAGASATPGRGDRISVYVSPLAVGLTQGRGGEVFTLRVSGRLDKQELGELVYASPPREIGAWLMDGGKSIDEALTSACMSIADQVVARLLAGR